MMSPRRMRSPGLTSHCTSVPVSISAPSDGMRNSVTFAHQIARSCDYYRHLGQRRFLQMPGIGHRHLGAAYALDGRVEFVKGALHDARADFGRQTAAAPSLIDDHRAMSPRYRLDYRVVIER